MIPVIRNEEHYNQLKKEATMAKKKKAKAKKKKKKTKKQRKSSRIFSSTQARIERKIPPMGVKQ